MNEIQKTIEIYDSLRNFQYKIHIENGLEIILRFSRENYHHLVGFQHLSDLPDVSTPKSKQKFYADLKRGKIRMERIQKSRKYSSIQERLKYFDRLESILAEGTGKIIVEFDENKTDTVIKAKFHLFVREGNPFEGKALFFILFIDCEQREIYYPVTYIVEQSGMYVRDQVMYDCSIERVPVGKKKLTTV